MATNQEILPDFFFIKVGWNMKKENRNSLEIKSYNFDCVKTDLELLMMDYFNEYEQKFGQQTEFGLLRRI